MSLARVALLVVTVVAAGEVDKQDVCSPSLLQIHSSIHEAGAHQQADCEGTRDDEVLPRSRAGGVQLLQVAARTGEVAQYLPSQHDEDAAPPASKSAHHDAKERHHGLESLLTRGGAIDKAQKQAPVDNEAEDLTNDKPEHKAKSEDDEKSEKSEKAEKSEKSEKSEKAENNENADEEKSKAKDEEPAQSKPDEPVAQGARIAPFGKEDTARELQHHAARTQDTLVDAIENAEVAEIKRSIFRSLTRLRAAEIKEFDTIARLETQAIDEYNDNHHYRSENPLDYIHTSEVGVKEDKYTSFHD